MRLFFDIESRVLFCKGTPIQEAAAEEAYRSLATEAEARGDMLPVANSTLWAVRLRTVELLEAAAMDVRRST